MGNVFDKEILSEEVSTSYGKIVGRRIIHEGNRQVNSFQAIPFAKAPINELRFKKPVPPDQWDGVRRCTAFGARSIQAQRSIFERFGMPPISEDCLHLNVFSPAWTIEEGKLFPVMLFVHGGGFCTDSTVKYGDIGISKYLVAECETVVVSIEYRLGYLGFYSTGDSACDDNAGLWDMTMALHWVHDNIHNFHGNKNNITVLGQSAGGGAVDLLSLSPHARDLFHRVIPMSGNADCHWAITSNAVEECRQLANKVGVETVDSHQTISKLRAVEAEKFALGMGDICVQPRVNCTIGPRIDGVFLPRPVRELRAEAPKKKRLIGVCQLEGMMFAFGGGDLGKLEACIASQIPEAKYPNFLELREKARSLYIEPKSHADKKAVFAALCKFMSDVFLGIDTQFSVLEQLRVQNEETYLYTFEYCNPESFGFAGSKLPIKEATHCFDLNYLFHICMFGNYKFNEDDMKVVRIITKLWSNFAKYGDPNGSPAEPASQLPFKWLPATDEFPSRYLSIKVEPQMKESFQDGRPKFWIDLEKN